jgi:hypothetical protein
MNGNSQPPVHEVQIPITKQVNCSGWQVGVVNSPDGNRILQVIDPGASAVYLIPLSPDLARELGGKLISAVPVAGVNEMPGRS